MKYARPPFPIPLYARFKKLAKKLGYTVDGSKWWLLAKLFDHAEKNADSFRRS